MLPVLQPAHRAGVWTRGADCRRRQGERARGQHEPRRAGRRHERCRRRRARRHDGRRAGEAERAGRIVHRRDRHRRRPPRTSRKLAPRRRRHLSDVPDEGRQELPARRLGHRDGTRRPGPRPQRVRRDHRLSERSLGHVGEVLADGARLRSVARVRGAAGCARLHLQHRVQAAPGLLEHPADVHRVPQLARDQSRRPVGELPRLRGAGELAVRDGDRVEVNWVPTGEHLAAPFEVSPRRGHSSRVVPLDAVPRSRPAPPPSAGSAARSPGGSAASTTACSTSSSGRPRGTRRRL